MGAVNTPMDKMTSVRALLMPGHTIWGIIMRENRHDVRPEERELLLAEYKRLNGEQVPRVGQSALIPVLARHAPEG
jgi:hypothetical protein